MTSPFDPKLSAVERMLTDRTLQPPPPALRSRVLTDIDAVLPKTVPGTKYGQAAQPHPPEYADLVAGTFLMGTALLLLIIAMLSSEAASRRIGGTNERPLLSFAQRAEAAGITLDAMPPATVQLASGLPYDTEIPRHNDTLRVLNTRSFLQGNL
ncbi:MAG: hypothetical protein NTY17_08745 [Planctomycetia bacterium]|nr:hypothetical protein [Planctomycetia bacterium]